jgi:diguanylate cyclase (GGDEF) domain
MKEVAEVDIPLNEVMEQAEMLQLKQHVFMEQFRRLGGFDQHSLDPKAQFSDRRAELVQLLNRATNVISENIDRHRVRFELIEHEELLDEINRFHQISDLFEKRLAVVLNESSLSEDKWREIETIAAQLDGSMNSILHQIESLSLEAARYTEKHEREFMFINGLLGVGAFVIGLLLTVYIIQIIRLRIMRIHYQVETIHQSLEKGSPIELNPSNAAGVKPQDELGELEQDLQKMVRRLSDEMVGRMEVERQLMMLATRDKLTGAYNRHKWDEQIKESLDLAQRGVEFSLIMLDIDHFKKINDEYGHQLGDKVLEYFVTSLNTCLRKSDLLFRMGGEEFAVLLPQQSLEKAEQVGERIRTHIETMEETHIPSFTVSLGISAYRAADDENSILARADKALYKSKLNGRNTVTLEIE